jgi:hypothetical protein
VGSIDLYLSEAGTTYRAEIPLTASRGSTFGRFLGCFMVGIIPEQGLGEALHSLYETLEFYNENPSPSIPRVTKQEPIHGTIEGRRKRPDLVIA